MKDILKQEYPWQYAKLSFAISLAFGVALYTSIVTIFVKPFDLDKFVIEGRYVEACIIFGITTFFVMMYFMQVNPSFFKPFYREWKVYKEILLLSICTFFITLINPLILELFYRSHENFDIVWVLRMVFQTNIGAIAPLIFIVLLNHLRLLKVRNDKYESQLIEISNKNEPYKLINDQTNITINEKDDYVLDLKNVLVVMAQGNYLEVFLLKNGQIKKELIRCTMTSFEDQVIQIPIFFRCHRTYMINLEMIKNITGNIKNGFSIFYDLLTFSIPVSKNKSNTFHQIAMNRNLFVE